MISNAGVISIYKLKAGLVSPASKLNGLTTSSGSMVILLPGIYTVESLDSTIASKALSIGTPSAGAAI